MTPFYNGAAHFEDLVECVLGQSLQQWEWIIVDDGSTDSRSLSLLEKTANRDARIRIIRQENQGPGAARNRGFETARAELVAQVDADDLLEPTALEKWLWFLTSYQEYQFATGYSVGFQAKEYLWERGFHEADEFRESNIVTITSLVRKSVHAEVGGYDVENCDGFEDWDFWMKCAASGHWGGTIPEHLDWYRRRESHADRWSNWDGGARQRAFGRELKQRYPALWREGMPKVMVGEQVAFHQVPDATPCVNRLTKDHDRVLMIVPWMTMGGSDRFTLDLVEQLVQRGTQVTLATTLHGENAWAHEFAKHTSDLFVMERFLRDQDFPRFLRYLIESRQIDTVLVTHSVLGYMLLPYLRSRCPNVAFLDYCHAETPDWLNGGYPRFAVGYQGVLDLSVVSSEHLKRWMIGRGGSGDTTEVCHTSIDAEQWQPDKAARAEWRSKLIVDDATAVLLYPVRLVDQKQPKVFAVSLRKLRDSGREFVAVVAGDGPDRSWVEGYFRKHGLTHQVRMLGPVPPDRMKSLVAASDILFLPSKLEGIALCLYEAMASGAVVVGADVGGQRELVTAECGILLDRSATADESGEYARILGELIDDPARRAELAVRSRARVVDEFTLDAMGDRMVDLIELGKRYLRSSIRTPIGSAQGLEAATTAIEYARLNDLAAHLWQNREQRLGMERSWRHSAYSAAARVHRRLPPSLQRLASRMFHRVFVNK